MDEAFPAPPSRQLQVTKKASPVLSPLPAPQGGEEAADVVAECPRGPCISGTLVFFWVRAWCTTLGVVVFVASGGQAMAMKPSGQLASGPVVHHCHPPDP